MYIVFKKVRRIIIFLFYKNDDFKHNVLMNHIQRKKEREREKYNTYILVFRGGRI